MRDATRRVVDSVAMALAVFLLLMVPVVAATIGLLLLVG